MNGDPFYPQHSLPLDYWATLNAPSALTLQNELSTLQTNLETIQQQQEAGHAPLRSYFTEALSPVDSSSVCEDSTPTDGPRLTVPAVASRPYSKIASPTGTRACSSLLSELLKPATPVATVGSPPSTVGTHGELVSDHGSLSTRSTPPMQQSPPPAAAAKRKTCISFACGPAPEKSTSTGAPALSRANSISTDRSASDEPALPKRTITFACGQSKISPEKKPQPVPMAPTAVATAPPAIADLSQEATPVPKRTISFGPAPARLPLHEDANRLSDGSAVHAPGHSGNSSRRPSIDAVLLPESRRPSLSTIVSGGSSPVMAQQHPRAAPTCKSTLDELLHKEQIAKVIEPVLEEDEEDEADEEQDEEDDEEDDDEDDEDEDEDEDLATSPFELDSDDDGYVEDVESDEDPQDEEVPLQPTISDMQEDDDVNDLFSNKRNSAGATPRQPPRFAKLNLQHTSAAIVEAPIKTPVYRTACPSESDLPDTTDFAPGTLDEDQPACVAFDCAVRDRALAKRIATPQDIDPTFPNSGSDSDSEAAVDRIDAQEAAKASRKGKAKGKGKAAGQGVIDSPGLHAKHGGAAVPLRFNSPPPARKSAWLVRARSLPARRSLVPRKPGSTAAQHKDKDGNGLYPPKPQRAVTIKQSNEQRAQRRRDKRELRHHLQGGPKPTNPRMIPVGAGETSETSGGAGEGVTTTTLHRDGMIAGHEKMKAIGCKTRKQAENPCLIRPVMSI